MIDATNAGLTALGGGFAVSEPVRPAATSPLEVVSSEPGEAVSSSVAVLLQKKHSFSCALPTRGSLCDC
jgi:hypothetical protein